MVVLARGRLEVVYANNAARRLLHPGRVRKGQPLPEPWPDFSMQAYAMQLFTAGVAREETVVHEGRALRISGITARDSDTAAILVEDITAHERRRRAEREFVANAAHELLTPLTGIVGAAHVLEAGAKEIPEERERFIAHIAHECDRLTKIARSLLVLARAQSGEQPPRLEVVPLCELLDEVVSIAAAETEIETSVECPADLTVFVDRDLFTQALLNLMLNGARHGAGASHISARPSGQRVTIDVADPGTLDPERLERMGDRFYTGGGLDGGGFGLGLSVARQSIEALGGALSLAAGEDEGLEARIEVLAG